MYNSDNSVRIKAFILSGLPTGAVSHTVKSILEESIKLTAVSHNAEQIMLSASEYILAYLDLGFSYLDHKDLFDRVLSSAGYSEAALQMLSRRNHEILCNKAQIDWVLGRWPRFPHNSHTKTQAVEEILQLVDTMSPGEYRYYTAKKEGTYSTLFILQIFDDCAIIHDVVQNRFYRLVK